MKTGFYLTSPADRHYGAALWAGFWGCNVASFVKWGTENPFPPRTPDRAIPPAEMLQDMGINVSNLVYHYSGHVVNWGVAGVHHLFSIFFALLYCALAEIIPIITLGQGVAFALIITVAFHAVILPINGWAPPLWHLPLAEIASETLGHILWMWTIEIFRRALGGHVSPRRAA